jgi:hypothetical protein
VTPLRLPRTNAAVSCPHGRDRDLRAFNEDRSVLVEPHWVHLGIDKAMKTLSHLRKYVDTAVGFFEMSANSFDEVGKYPLPKAYDQPSAR